MQSQMVQNMTAIGLTGACAATEFTRTQTVNGTWANGEIIKSMVTDHMYKELGEQLQCARTSCCCMYMHARAQT